MVANAMTGKQDPQRYNVLNMNATAARVIYGSDGRTVQIAPNEWKLDVWLNPEDAERLNRGDLAVQRSAVK
jgi:hypothetical protein